MPKTITFTFSKKRYVATPLLTKNWCFFVKVVCFETKTLMLNKKQNLKAGTCKDKKKRFERRTRQEPPPPPKKKRKY